MVTPVARMKRRSDGIIYVEITPGIEQTPEKARENLEAAIKLAGGQKLSVLLDLRGALPLTSDTRKVYASEEISDAFAALAILTHLDPISRMMGNFYLKFANLAIPTRLFTEAVKALEWLHNRQST
ncbi:MAG TPA: hypothetical protein VFV50_14685 [Bdellovibrionales bacterium]|nr:hypothetical protein [Bdellovibrionales bacterium]